jgi:prepilin-type N-terminal cleavage/methylation domain-containing protein
MKKIYQNKKGFTLVELMLAIAIILLISGLFVDLVIATHESYYTTYNRNDASDYAQLYGKMIQDRILADRQDNAFASNTKRTYLMNTTDSQFYSTANPSTPVVAMPGAFLQNGTSPKWTFCISNVNYDTTTCMCTVSITVIDNFHSPGEVILTYDQTFWIPNMPNTPKVTVAGTNNAPVTINGGTVDNYRIEVTKV